MKASRKPRLYIRPDPLGFPFEGAARLWFATLGARTWCLGEVRFKPVAYAIEELCWLLRHG